MTRLESRTLHLTALLVAGSGVAVAVAKYLLPNDDPFAVTSTPWQPWALAAHVLLSPPLIFGIGYIFRRHILGRIKDRHLPGRTTGIGVLYLFAFLAVGGYALQVTTNETIRQVLSLSHIGVGSIFIVAFALHGRLRAVRPVELASPADAWLRAPQPDSPGRAKVMVTTQPKPGIRGGTS